MALMTCQPTAARRTAVSEVRATRHLSGERQVFVEHLFLSPTGFGIRVASLQQLVCRVRAARRLHGKNLVVVEQVV